MAVRTLWRVLLYFLPGFPRPTMSHGSLGGFLASTSAVLELDGDGDVAEDEN